MILAAASLGSGFAAFAGKHGFVYHHNGESWITNLLIAAQWSIYWFYELYDYHSLVVTKSHWRKEAGGRTAYETKSHAARYRKREQTYEEISGDGANIRAALFLFHDIFCIAGCGGNGTSADDSLSG
ncbi:hypothetical protein [Paenibacillus luteus]|uniref:hypothetical protein n=1 Tax=Paenibacillus luteus TaxID=2545753 RepID=UPI001F502722|nr:hypothetical protein [Paenibacillus luteus]